MRIVTPKEARDFEVLMCGKCFGSGFRRRGECLFCGGLGVVPMPENKLPNHTRNTICAGRFDTPTGFPRRLGFANDPDAFTQHVDNRPVPSPLPVPGSGRSRLG